MKKEDISYATKKKLADALKTQMQKKPFQKITVRELLELADVTRPTFYYHFEDIYALMQWMFDTELVELLKRSEDCTTWDEGILLVLKYIEQNRKVCLCAYNSVGVDVLQKMFRESVTALVEKFVGTLLIDIPAHPEHAEFISQFYTTALVHTAVQWLLCPQDRTPEDMIRLLDITLHGNIEAALHRSASLQ